MTRTGSNCAGPDRPVPIGRADLAVSIYWSRSTGLDATNRFRLRAPAVHNGRHGHGAAGSERRSEAGVCRADRQQSA